MKESRYARQEAFEKIGNAGQKKLKKSRVAIVGVGALGTVASELLVRAGIGNLVLIDHDVVDITNLQRQSMFEETDIGKPKASTAKMHLQKINSETKITAHDKNLNYENIDLINSDLAIDCTDNLDTRFLINEYCKKKKIPWVHGAAVQDKGIVYAMTNRFNDEPCFKCIFPNVRQGGSCEEFGILNSTSHIVGSFQAIEGIKILLGEKPNAEIIRINVWNGTIEKIKVKKNPDCVVCKGKYMYLDGKTANSCGEEKDFRIQKCKTRVGLSVKPKKNMKLNFGKIKKKYKTIIETPILLVIKDEEAGQIIVHNYGELLFKELKDEKRIRKIAEEIYEIGK